jgi:hypothetical protein
MSKTTGCKQLPHFVRSYQILLQIFAMPLQPHRPPSFYPFPPETYLLTEKAFNKHYPNNHPANPQIPKITVQKKINEISEIKKISGPC